MAEDFTLPKVNAAAQAARKIVKGVEAAAMPIPAVDYGVADSPVGQACLEAYNHPD
jgi:hypothetical protein